MKHWSKRHTQLIWITAAIIAAGILLYGLIRLGMPIYCLFYQITGLSCPGCGNTRVVLSLLEGDILRAFSYNLLFPVGFLYIGYVYICCSIHYLKKNRFAYRSPAPVVDWIVLGVILLWWVIRNILHI